MLTIGAENLFRVPFNQTSLINIVMMKAPRMKNNVEFSYLARCTLSAHTTGIILKFRHLVSWEREDLLILTHLYILTLFVCTL